MLAVEEISEGMSTSGCSRGAQERSLVLLPGWNELLQLYHKDPEPPR